MRKLFTSPRIENVEAVAKLLEDAGIEVRVANGRGYRGAIRGNFSYRDPPPGSAQPSVWVIRSDQQPEARRLLREAGLLQDLPVRGESYLPAPATLAGGDRSPLAARGGGRFRYGMLLAIAVMVALVMAAYRAGSGGTEGDSAHIVGGPGAAPDTQVARTAPAAPAIAPEGDEGPGAQLPGMPGITTLPETAFVLATPPALAEAMARSELAAAGTVRGCLTVDGADPDPAVLQALGAEGFYVVPGSACNDDRLAVRVGGWTTDGSGSGTVEVASGDAAPRNVRARREGRDWVLDAGG